MMKVSVWSWLAALWLFCVASPCSAQPPALGAYVGNDPTDLIQFEKWLGKPVDQVAVHTGRANWNDWVNSIRWSLSRWTSMDKPIAWTIPFFADGGTLRAAAAGEYQIYYKQAAEILKDSRRDDSVIYVRIGEEFNGNWMPWSAAGHEQEFIEAYRQFVDAFRSVSNRFRFEWNLNMGETRMEPTNAYPGDDYVDVVGMDFYYNIQWNPTNATAAWDEMVHRPFGLDWLEQFAHVHKKPTAYPEWGVNSDGAGPYIQNAAKWFSNHNVLYQRVWNSNSAFPGKLSDGKYPHAAAAYISSFGQTGGRRSD
jgi:hypothetical protein